jgi:glycosyltransferase involved in cell wall biosynthesis
LKELAARLHRAIAIEKPDAILSFGCEPIAYLEPGLPAYVICDATFKQISNVYPHFQNLCERSKATGEAAQVRAFTRVAGIMPSSNWAKQSASTDYGVPESKLRVIPFGANLTSPPSAEEVCHAIEARVLSSEQTFLFVGVEWERKGGDAAVALVQLLIERGVDAKLHIVGCMPPPAVMAKAFVVHHGFLSKANEAQAATLRNLLLSATFFLMPSKADCSPIVFCESSAFGVPSISRAVGGIPEVVTSGSTGFLLADDLSEEQLLGMLLETASDPECYRRMALAARADFENRLNWDAYATQLCDFIHSASAVSDPR